MEGRVEGSEMTREGRGERGREGMLTSCTFFRIIIIP